MRQDTRAWTRSLVNRADWAAPDGVGDDWLIANAPRPLDGEITWEGGFCHGRYYAAAPASAAVMAGWRAADARLVRFTTNEQITAEVSRYLADHGYASAEEAGVTIEDIARDLNLPWARTATTGSAEGTAPAGAAAADVPAPADTRTADRR